MVLAQRTYPDNRIEAWANALVSVVDSMGVYMDMSGSEVRPVQHILKRLFVSDYVEEARLMIGEGNDLKPRPPMAQRQGLALHFEHP